MDFANIYSAEPVPYCASAHNRKFQCLQCFKILSSKQNFKEHSYIHTGEKPFCCPEPGCHERFRQGSQLSVHRKMHRQVEMLQVRTLIKVPKVTSTQLTDLLTLEIARKHGRPGAQIPSQLTQKLPDLGVKQDLDLKLPCYFYYVE